VVGGTVIASLAIGRWGDRWGRRRSYVIVYFALAVTGVVFAFSDQVWGAQCGRVGRRAVHGGRQVGPLQLSGRARIRGFGLHNAVATAAGSVGALAAGGPDLLRHVRSGTPADQAEAQARGPRSSSAETMRAQRFGELAHPQA
jgi:MFS family permease